MKVTLTIDDALLRETDVAVRRIGGSRSSLIALALREFLQRRHCEEMLHWLNTVHAGGMDEDDKAFVRAAKAKMSRVLEAG